MPEKIAIVKESGETINSNVVSIFTVPDTQKKYIITTENAVDPHGLTVLHVSEVNDTTLSRVATDNEWNSIKTIMRAIISGNAGSYQYASLITEAKAEGQYSRDISVSSSASQQMIDNYNAGRALIEKNVEELSAKQVQDSNLSETVQKENVNEELEAAPEGTTIFPENGGSDPDSQVIPGIEEAEVATEPNVVVPPTEPVVAETKPAVEPVVAETTVAENVNTEIPAEPVQDATPEESSPEVTLNSTVTVGQNETQNVATINLNAVPSFDPNATLDEVIIAAQNVFIEGTKNLIATMTEKIYRDLHIKEAELKERETVLNEREKMLNEQMANMLGNMNNVNGVNDVPVDNSVESVPVIETPAEPTQEASPVESSSESSVTPVVV
ncbi:MAG: hypothetical protein ACI4WW_07415 [Candidatus Coprovivens sp.]